MSHQINNNEFVQGNVPVTQVITHDVKLVEEKIHQREEQHIQPIVERDIEQRVVKQIIQPVHETQVLPTQHATGVLAGEEILINNDRAVAPQFVPEANRIVGATDVNVVQHAPIIEERYHKQIVEEVQPVLYRDVIQNKETILTQPIHERIIDAPIVTQVTRGMMEMNTGSGIPVQPVLVATPIVEAPREIVREVIVDRPVEVIREVIVDRPVEVIREVPVAAPIVAPAQAAFAVIPDGVPVVHDGKIVNAGFGGHDAGQVIRPIETGLQTHGAGIGTGAHNHGNNHGTTHGAHGAHGPILVKHANETHAEKQARKQQQKELKKQESADARAARKLAKEQKRASKRPHESAADRKARKAEKKRLAAAHHSH